MLLFFAMGIVMVVDFSSVFGLTQLSSLPGLDHDSRRFLVEIGDGFS